MKKKVALFVSALFVFLLIGCGESDIKTVEKDEETNVEDVEDQSEEETDTEEIKKLSIGDSVDFDGVIITLNEARVEPGGEFDTPEEDKFIVVNLTAENTTDEEQAISSILNVELKDQDAYTYSTTILIDGTKGQFDGSVEPGGKLRGEIPFDVAESESYELHYSNPFKTGKAIWTFSSSELTQ